MRDRRSSPAGATMLTLGLLALLAATSCGTRVETVVEHARGTAGAPAAAAASTSVSAQAPAGDGSGTRAVPTQGGGQVPVPRSAGSGQSATVTRGTVGAAADIGSMTSVAAGALARSAGPGSTPARDVSALTAPDPKVGGRPAAAEPGAPTKRSVAV